MKTTVQPREIVEALRAAGCGIVRRPAPASLPHALGKHRVDLPPSNALASVLTLQEVSRGEGPTLKTILSAVAYVYGISLPELKSDRRHVPTVRARQAFFWLARELTSHSLPAIGKVAGFRDHTTVLHGCRKVANKRDFFEPELSRVLECFKPKQTEAA